MSIEDTIVKRLEEHGLFNDQAKAVVESMKVAPGNEVMEGRWRDATSDYPPSILQMAWMSAKLHAVEWIDANCPAHWARGMFAN